MEFSPILADLIAQAEAEWGDPEEKRANMLYYGINYVDDALFGIDQIRGEVIGIQAREKRRKSTMLYNVLYNVALQLAKDNRWVCIDTLESGAPPQAVRDIFIAMAATRKLISDVFGTKRKEWPKYDEMMQHPELAPRLRLSKEFLLYSKRTKEQFEAIEWAKNILSALPILIFGASPHQGDASKLGGAVQRWHDLYLGQHPKAKGKEVRVFARDHLQQIAGYRSDYDRLEAVVSTDANFVSTHPKSVVFAVSQVSMTSVRFERQGLGEVGAKGGPKLGAECNVLFRTKYDKNDSPHQMRIEVQETRRRPPPPVIQELEPNSGAFLRPAFPAGKF